MWLFVDRVQKVYERFYTPCVHGFEQLCVPKVHNKAKIPILSIGIERDRSRLLTEKCK